MLAAAVFLVLISFTGALSLFATGDLPDRLLGVCFFLFGLFFLIAAVVPESRRLWERHRLEVDRCDREARGRELAQQSIGRQLANHAGRAHSQFVALPGHLEEAAKHLDRAEVDYRERAFTPFWDAIEAAFDSIGAFADGLDAITFSANEFTALAPSYEQKAPEFDVPLSELPDAEATKPLIERIARLVRTAHRDYQFATIYEQRRTTGTVERGFRDLRESIGQMADSIVASVSNLQSSVDALHRTAQRGYDTIEGKLHDVETAVNSADAAQAQRDLRAARARKSILRRL